MCFRAFGYFRGMVDQVIAFLVPMVKEVPLIATVIMSHLFLRQSIKYLKKDHSRLEKKIDKIEAGQTELVKGQAKLEVKIAEGQTELYKHLGIKNKNKDKKE